MKKLQLTICLLFIFIFTAIAQNYPHLRWVKVNDGNIPKNAVIGGEENGSPFFIARGSYMGGVHPGKTKQGWYNCNIGYGGNEIELKEYEVLVYNKDKSGMDDVIDKIFNSKSKKLAGDVHEILDSYPNDSFSLFLSDDEVKNLERKLDKVQKNALDARCYDLSDEIDSIKDALNKPMPSRSGMKEKLNKIYEISKNCK